jgi:hypothetical protein
MEVENVADLYLYRVQGGAGIEFWACFIAAGQRVLLG